MELRVGYDCVFEERGMDWVGVVYSSVLLRFVWNDDLDLLSAIRLLFIVQSNDGFL